VTLIEPMLMGSRLKADIEAANPGDGLVIWWLGQSGFLAKSAFGSVLFDPYLSNSLTRKYANTDKPHVRMTALAIVPDELPAIDVVTCSHIHTDHFDVETLRPLFAINSAVVFVIPEATRSFVVDRLGCDPAWPRGMTDGDNLVAGEFELLAVPAAHNEIERDERGRCHCLGYVVRVGRHTLYHSGDTLRYPEMTTLLRPLSVDVALLPINGNRPERRVAGNMFGDEAAQLAHDIGARIVVPCHYDMFEFNTESPALFVNTCRRLNQPYRVLQCGERLTIDGPLPR
jgi:L-ascorbate metabolism protein UlaG (beta-lactamase superfamily)